MNSNARQEVFCYGCEHAWFNDEWGHEQCPRCNSTFVLLIEDSSEDPRNQPPDEPHHQTTQPFPGLQESRRSSAFPVRPNNQTSGNRSQFLQHDPFGFFTERHRQQPYRPGFPRPRVQEQSTFQPFSLFGGYPPQRSASQPPQDPMSRFSPRPGSPPQHPEDDLFGSDPQSIIGGHFARLMGSHAPDGPGAGAGAGPGRPRVEIYSQTNPHGSFSVMTTSSHLERGRQQPVADPFADLFRMFPRSFQGGAFSYPNQGDAMHHPPQHVQVDDYNRNPMDSIMAIAANSILSAVHGQHGGGFNIRDYVASDEALDRIAQNLHQPHQGQGTPQSVIDRIPKRPLTTIDTGGENAVDCNICLEPCKIGDEVKILPCKHWWHAECIDKWLSDEGVSCPICRTQVTAENVTNGDPQAGNSASPQEQRGGNAFAQGAGTTTDAPHLVSSRATSTADDTSPTTSTSNRTSSGDQGHASRSRRSNSTGILSGLFGRGNRRWNLENMTVEWVLRPDNYRPQYSARHRRLVDDIRSNFMTMRTHYASLADRVISTANMAFLSEDHVDAIARLVHFSLLRSQSNHETMRPGETRDHEVVQITTVFYQQGRGHRIPWNGIFWMLQCTSGIAVAMAEDVSRYIGHVGDIILYTNSTHELLLRASQNLLLGWANRAPSVGSQVVASKHDRSSDDFTTLNTASWPQWKGTDGHDRVRVAMVFIRYDEE